MDRFIVLVLVVLAVCCSCSTLWAYTLTFDDIPVGNDIGLYGDRYGAVFTIDWMVASSAELNWSKPHSEPNVAVWNGPVEHGAGIRFGRRDEDIPEYRYTIRSMKAHFSTDMDAVLRVVGYDRTTWSPVASALIGAPGESWRDRYVEISSQAGNIGWIMFEGISSLDARYRFSIDDLTIIPVPEPSSFLALGMGGVGMLGMALRRRRR